MLPLSTLIHNTRLAAGLTVLDVARRIVPDPADENERCDWVDRIRAIERDRGGTVLGYEVEAIATALGVDERTRRLLRIANHGGDAASAAQSLRSLPDDTALAAEDLITAVPSATPERMRAALRVLRGESEQHARQARYDRLAAERARIEVKVDPLPLRPDIAAEYVAFEPRDSDADGLARTWDSAVAGVDLARGTDRTAVTINVGGGIFDEGSFLRAMERAVGRCPCGCGARGC
jgi:hypothetical protein